MCLVPRYKIFTGALPTLWADTETECGRARGVECFAISSMTSWGSSEGGREDGNQLIKARESMGKLTCLRLYRPYDLEGPGNARKGEFPDCLVGKSSKRGE